MPVTNWKELQEIGNKADKFPELKGTHTFYIKEAEASTHDDGWDRINATCIVESGERQNAKVWHNFNFNPSNPTGVRIAFEQLNVLGIGDDFFNQNPSKEQIAQQLVGRRFRAEAIKNGKYTNLKTFEPAGAAGAPGPMGPGATGPAGPGTMSPQPSTPNYGNGPAIQTPQPTMQQQPPVQQQEQPGPPAQPQAYAQGQNGNPNNGWGNGQPQAQPQAQAPQQENPWNAQAQPPQQDNTNPWANASPPPPPPLPSA